VPLAPPFSLCAAGWYGALIPTGEASAVKTSSAPSRSLHKPLGYHVKVAHSCRFTLSSTLLLCACIDRRHKQGSVRARPRSLDGMSESGGFPRARQHGHLWSRPSPSHRERGDHPSLQKVSTDRRPSSFLPEGHVAWIVRRGEVAFATTLPCSRQYHWQRRGQLEHQRASSTHPSTRQDQPAVCSGQCRRIGFAHL
jgi:hypothetical protein